MKSGSRIGISACASSLVPEYSFEYCHLADTERYSNGPTAQKPDNNNLLVSNNFASNVRSINMCVCSCNCWLLCSCFHVKMSEHLIVLIFHEIIESGGI